ncbi:MAG: hypothetical protein II353_01755, partial [Alistipes sp.]|nr:hypothetical protein [Alistipes sp.]
AILHFGRTDVLWNGVTNAIDGMDFDSLNVRGRTTLGTIPAANFLLCSKSTALYAKIMRIKISIF